MASKYWIKLYHEILDDPKMGRLPANLWQRFIECCLMAGEFDKGGKLPPMPDISWRLRVDEQTLSQEFDALARHGLLDYATDRPLDSYWLVVNFAKRQEPVSASERMQRMRDRSKKGQYYEGVTHAVTNRNTDTDTDTDTDKNISPAIAATYAEFLKVWSETFPKKPQPRTENKTLQGKLKTRLKASHFRDNWQTALTRGSASSFLANGSWFGAAWFLKNDDNYEKVLNGNYDNGETNGRPPSAISEAEAEKLKRDPRPEVVLDEFGRY